MPNSKQIVYLSQAQYAELITNGSITVNGVTVTYDENDIYVTPQAEPVTDVRVNGTSVAANGVANIPVAGTKVAGVAKFDSASGIGINPNTQEAYIRTADESWIKAGTRGYNPITPVNQHHSTFYGLAKASGDTTQSQSSNSVGTYTPEAKGAIQKMLGVSDLIATAENNLVASKAYKVGDVFTANGKLYKATAAIAADGAIITDGANANCEEVTVADNFVKTTDYVSSTNQTAGIVGVTPLWSGIKFGVNGMAQLNMPADGLIKQGTDSDRAILIAKQHLGTFYGLAKAAGADEKDSTLPVGQYTDNAKAAIRTMIGATSSNVIAVQDTQPTDTDTKIWLPETAETPVEVPTVAEMNAALAGKVGDVQVNGTSVVSSGVANVPKASTNDLGVVKIPGVQYGITINANGVIFPGTAISTEVKAGTQEYKQLTPNHQHEAAFYGFAKAAGDTTQAVSSNEVGTYTDEAKEAIKSMLGIDLAALAAEVEIPLVETVTGTDVTINGQPNTRYNCSEVSTITINPPAAGSIDVIFTSGTSVAVLTLPSTVKMPAWFDATALETDTIYEILITDGVYGSVMTWPV